MSNMSYCRFRNTASDLSDCLANFHEPSSQEEIDARLRLVKTAQKIVEEGIDLGLIEDPNAED